MNKNKKPSKRLIKSINESETIIKEIKEVVSNEINDDNKKTKTKMTKKEKELMLNNIETQMKEAAKNLDFERAMELRDILFELKSN